MLSPQLVVRPRSWVPPPLEASIGPLCVLRTGDYKRHAAYWEVMRSLFDECMRHTWENLAEAGVAATTFYPSHKEVLALFADPVDLQRIFEASDKIAEASAELRRVSSNSLIGSSLLKGEVLKLNRASFQHRIDAKLADLQHLDFEQVSLQAFRESMLRETKDLVKSGAKAFERVASTVSYMGADIKIWCDGLNDEWEYRLAAVARTSAVNSGQLPMLPWESAAYEVKTIPNASAYGHIPEELLCSAIAARDVAAGFLGENGADSCLVLKDMRRIMAARSKHLKLLDRTFELDLLFLEGAVEGIIRDKVEEQILGSLPSASRPTTLKEAIHLGTLVGFPITTPGGDSRGASEVVFFAGRRCLGGDRPL